MIIPLVRHGLPKIVSDRLCTYQTLALPISDIARLRWRLAELLHIASTSGLNRIAAFLYEGVIGTIIDPLESKNIAGPKRRTTMPYGADHIRYRKQCSHLPDYCETDHIDELTR